MTNEEKIEYYNNLRNKAEKIEFSEKMDAFHQKMTPFAVKLNKGVAQGAEKKYLDGVFEREVMGLENLPEGPALYIANHSNMSDVSCVYDAIQRPFYIMADADQKKEFATNLFNNLIGVIYVKRYYTDEEMKCVEVKVDPKISPETAKLRMINALLNNRNCVMFFEGTWCMSPNELVLPTKFGNIDIAIAGKVPIVPIAVEYLYKDKVNKSNKVIISIQPPLYFNELADKAQANEDVRSSIATERYLIQEKYSKRISGTYTQEDFDETLIKCMMAYPSLSYKEEAKVVRNRDKYGDYYQRQEEYAHLEELRQEALRRKKQMRLSRLRNRK